MVDPSECRDISGEKERCNDAERLLLEHVHEFGPIDMEGTDEHLAGCDRLVRLYYEKRDWSKAKEALCAPVETAKRIGRPIGSWHVLRSTVVLQDILVQGGEYERAEGSTAGLMPILKEMALPEITAAPMYAGTCLRAQMAHVGEDWTSAAEQWRLALTLGQSVGWPEEVGLALPICALEAIDWETGKEEACEDDKVWTGWRERLFARRLEAGEEDFLGRFGEVWKETLVERVGKVRLQKRGKSS